MSIHGTAATILTGNRPPVLTVSSRAETATRQHETGTLTLNDASRRFQAQEE
jgi:hypothetical protein